MVEAYAYCRVTPNQYWDYTPAELDMMVRVIKSGIEERPAPPAPARFQSDDEMELAVKTFVHPVLNSVGGPL